MKMLSARDIATLKGYSRQRVWELAKRRGIKPKAKIGRVALWSEEDFLLFDCRDAVKSAARRVCRKK